MAPHSSTLAWKILWKEETGRLQFSVQFSSIQSLSHVRLFATPWTIAHQVPLSMEFSRQEYWSGFPFPSLGDLPYPGIEPRSSAFSQILYHLSHQGSPEWGISFSKTTKVCLRRFIQQWCSGWEGEMRPKEPGPSFHPDRTFWVSGWGWWWWGPRQAWGHLAEE